MPLIHRGHDTGGEVLAMAKIAECHAAASQIDGPPRPLSLAPLPVHPAAGRRAFFFSQPCRGATSNSDGGIGKLSVRRIFRCPQIDTGPRRSPSACSEILKKDVEAVFMQVVSFWFEAPAFLKK